MDLPARVKKKFSELPDKPGCYMMRDRRGLIIYVGKAASLRKRVQSYFRQATFRSASPQLRGLIRSVWDVDWIVVRNEAEAVLTEGRLIKEYRPRYNVSFRDDKRFLLLRADPGQPFPQLKLCRIQRSDGALYFGPYASSAAARATLDFAEKKFGLRKCAPRVPSEETYKHCINDIVRYCSAPCIGKVTQEEYHVGFEETCAFLRGERPQYLKELRVKMEEASDQMAFERAAALRDTLLLLDSAVKQRARIASTPEMKKQEAKAGVQELQMVLQIGHIPHTIEAYDVSNISGTYSAASMVCFVDGMPHRNRYRHFRIKSVEGVNDPGMMAEVVRRQFSRLMGETDSTHLRGSGRFPDLVLVDGGITQLRAARAELKQLGLDNIPVAGLAKRFEELYWKNSGPPIRLGKDSRALKVLQRLRDEAHRFALTYHRHLRSQRIKESVLDDIPGIGSKRKRLLLEYFGSVRQLAKATEDEITEVPGIGPELARTIREKFVGRVSDPARTHTG